MRRDEPQLSFGKRLVVTALVAVAAALFHTYAGTPKSPTATHSTAPISQTAAR